ncbi:MAG: CDP-alcohol phosphatidyltransferase family protein [Brumimicrobium sp.]
MISMYKIKPKFQQLLKPLLDWLFKVGVTANQLTVAAIILSLGIGISLWFANEWHFGYLIVPIGLLLRMVLNALDGMMARNYSMQSRLGEVSNELGDVVSDMFIYIPLMMFQGVYPELIALFVGLAIVNEFSGVMGKVIGKERRYDGPMGKSDRAFVVGALCLTYYFVTIDAWVINGLIALCSLLIIISSIVRIHKTLKNG